MWVSSLSAISVKCRQHLNPDDAVARSILLVPQEKIHVFNTLLGAKIPEDSLCSSGSH